MLLDSFSPQRRYRPWLLAIVLTGLVLAGIAEATERERSAHAHGVSELNVAIEGEDVEIALISPASDIVGFEHAPRNEAEHAAVEKASKLLAQGAALFQFPANARCAFNEAEVHAIEETGQTPNQAGRKDRRPHDETERAHSPEPHAEFRARYHIRCAKPAEVTHVQVNLFGHFAGIRKVEAQTLTPRGQSAQALTATSARLDL